MNGVLTRSVVVTYKLWNVGLFRIDSDAALQAFLQSSFLIVGIQWCFIDPFGRFPLEKFRFQGTALYCKSEEKLTEWYSKPYCQYSSSRISASFTRVVCINIVAVVVVVLKFLSDL